MCTDSPEHSFHDNAISTILSMFWFYYCLSIFKIYNSNVYGHFITNYPTHHSLSILIYYLHIEHVESYIATTLSLHVSAKKKEPCL